MIDEDAIKHGLPAMFKDADNFIHELADIRMAELKNVVRMCGGWNHERMDELKSQISHLESVARVCLAARAAVDADVHLGEKIYLQIKKVERREETEDAAYYLREENRISYTGKKTHYIDGTLRYRETGDVVPDDDKPRDR